MISRKKNVISTSITRHEPGALCGAEITVTVRSENIGHPAGRARCDPVEHAGRNDGADHLRDDVWDHITRGAPLAGPQTDGDGGIEMTARDMADRIGHRQHDEAERQYDTEKADPERGKCRSQNGTAAAAEGQPECAKELGPGTAGHVHFDSPSLCLQPARSRSTTGCHARFASLRIARDSSVDSHAARSTACRGSRVRRKAVEGDRMMR
jgi:hypothetical protein